MELPLNEAKTLFRNWWRVMQRCQSKYGDPDESEIPFETTPEYHELGEAHNALLIELQNSTGIDAYIFRKTVLMAMNNVLDDDDEIPTEAQVDRIMELTIGYSAAATAKVRRMDGELLN